MGFLAAEFAILWDGLVTSASTTAGSLTIELALMAVEVDASRSRLAVWKRMTLLAQSAEELWI